MTDWRYWKNLPKFKDLPTSYAQLVRVYPPRPIRNASELAKATEIIDVMAGNDLNRDQDDYLDLLSILVSAYEDENHPVQAKELTPLEALKYLLDENGMNASDLGRLLGNREVGSKILRGERGLSMSHIAILAERFAMGAELFMPKAGRKQKATKRGGSWRGVVRARMR